MTTPLITTPNLARPDDIYDRLVALHDGLDEMQSHQVNWRLILLLANHIGDDAVVFEAIACASQSADVAARNGPAT